MRLISIQDADTAPPVESWNPPYHGDIGLTIEADGTWLYRGSPILRQPIVRLFSRVLRRDSDGRHYLVTPVEKVDVTVIDAPFLAVECEVQGFGSKQHLIFRTNVDDIICCNADHPIRFLVEQGNGGLKPYLRVRGGLEALITRALTYDLIDLAVPGDGNDEGFYIWSDGQRFALQASAVDH
ncbi:MAG: DUF1285 domain-containing protein [Hyphomicrobiaceae bacterium]